MLVMLLTEVIRLWMHDKCRHINSYDSPQFTTSKSGFVAVMKFHLCVKFIICYLFVIICSLFIFDEYFLLKK